MARRSYTAVPVLFFFRFIRQYQAAAWTTSYHRPWLRGISIRPLSSNTPFEVDLYHDSSPSRSALAVSPETRLVLGLNKYIHDTTICAADADTGKVLFGLSLERLTRIKHDAGNVASLVDECLDALELPLENIETIVMNNHHRRILPLEREHNETTGEWQCTTRSLRHLEWQAGLLTGINNAEQDGINDPENLLCHCTDIHELSHHLAHAFSTATQAPFDHGICVVMDGMGETYRTMRHAQETNDPSYTSDFTLLERDGTECQLVPHDIAEQVKSTVFDWREAESVYRFRKSKHGIDIFPIFKRFVPDHSFPTLYNHGLEHMDSVGAVYSRASSHIFGDWNSCGNVMGMAPWVNHTWVDDESESAKHPRTAPLHMTPILSGSVYNPFDPLQINRTLLDGTPLFTLSDPDLSNDQKRMSSEMRYRFDDYHKGDIPASTEFPDPEFSVMERCKEKLRLPTSVALEAIGIASRVQTDLEKVTLDFVEHFRGQTKETNLCLAGDVALNSVLNSRLSRELAFERIFVSPYPGDEGVAVGCCAFGLYGRVRSDRNMSPFCKRGPPVWQQPITPYLGPEHSEQDLNDAIETFQSWLEVDTIRNNEQRLDLIASTLQSGGIVAWYHSRSELGPRALGHRSILADPRRKGLARFINEDVKHRDVVSPLAHSVLADEVSNWFDLGDAAGSSTSPYMSFTAFAHEDQKTRIPAVVDIVGSSRFQTVHKDSEHLFYRLLSKFYELTGIPLILNTSFNTLPGEPIVESPLDAIRSFLYTKGAINVLVMGDYVIKRKTPSVRTLLGEVSLRDTSDICTESIRPKRTGHAQMESSFVLSDDTTTIDAETDLPVVTRVRMPDRPLHADGNNDWFELLDELEGEILSVCDGHNTVNDILAFYTELENDKTVEEGDVKSVSVLVQNIVYRLIRLYEETLIEW